MINSCYKITVDQFCDCLFEKQFNILQCANEEQEQRAWNTIFVEYCELMEDAQYNDAFHLLREIQALNAKIHVIALCADYLLLIRDKDVERILYEVGIKVSDDYSVLQLACIARIKRLTAELQVMQQELDKMMDKKTETGRDSFEDSLLELGYIRKIHLKATEVTIFQFCRMIKDAKRLADKNALKSVNA